MMHKKKLKKAGFKYAVLNMKSDWKDFFDEREGEDFWLGAFYFCSDAMKFQEEKEKEGYFCRLISLV